MTFQIIFVKKTNGYVQIKQIKSLLSDDDWIDEYSVVAEFEEPVDVVGLGRFLMLLTSNNQYKKPVTVTSFSVPDKVKVALFAPEPPPAEPYQIPSVVHVNSAKNYDFVNFVTDVFYGVVILVLLCSCFYLYSNLNSANQSLIQQRENPSSLMYRTQIHSLCLNTFGSVPNVGVYKRLTTLKEITDAMVRSGVVEK